MPATIQLPPCNNPKVPQAGHPFRHIVDVQTRFNDFDLLGHLNTRSTSSLWTWPKSATSKR